ncbi:unnamed protein product [Orchesella dallaii]|uniref:Uncharacterized protein n=1 Tax=Orchesella dallaii TaxID=48710 RepID=A0ABP1S4W0_9HEXA
MYIVDFPYQADRRYWVDSEIPDKKVHTGEEEDFKLGRHFSDYISFQEGKEALDLKLRNLTTEEQEEFEGLSADNKKRFVRWHIRSRYPGQVTLASGTLYSPALNVLLEAFGKIKKIRQAKIGLSAIYRIYTLLARRVSNSRDALREACRMNVLEENTQEIDQFDILVPDPSNTVTRPNCLSLSTPRTKKRNASRFVQTSFIRKDFKETIYPNSAARIC